MTAHLLYASQVCLSNVSDEHLMTFCKLEYFLYCANTSNTAPASSAIGEVDELNGGV